MPATAVLTPTTRPRPSTSAPPELPGLSAASVWMTSSTIRVVAPSASGASGRARRRRRPSPSRAKPCGLPIATTSWPTRSAAASPSVGRRVRLALGAQHGEVGERVRPHHARLELAAVGERRADPRPPAPALDDVRGGEHEAVGRDHDAGAAAAAGDAEVRDRRRERLGDVRDDARVRVERLRLARQRAGRGGLGGVVVARVTC